MLIDILKAKDKLKSGSLDMEPFEILRDMLREDKKLIGGAPQLVKV